LEWLRVLQVDERQAGIELVLADLEDADHRELLEARNHPGRRDLALRHDQHQLVADQHA
jgi:hypothetical protein